VSNGPIRFAFGLHLHQPVGNFGHVFEQHVRDVYRPLLARVVGAGLAPISIHLSGPLLEWLEQYDTKYLDELGRFVSDGRVELLLAGMYEPVLAALPREDRLQQVVWLREAIQRRFGVVATGLWLTERVWEPDLAADLADAGVRYVLLDDRHFIVSGFSHNQLHAPYVTENAGKRVNVFPIDEQLRYLVPFRPPAEIGAYLTNLRAQGHQLAVLADDGEKFGGWPGTLEWVYNSGWLEGFLAELDRLRDAGEIVLNTFTQALDAVTSGGLAYLPTASYREMEAWSLPPDQSLRLAALEKALGDERIAGPEGALLRGSHWKNFMVRYAESNRAHKMMLALSALARERNAPEPVRRAIGRAQCNDAYWHGVFGGLYLPHLREGVWRNLAHAERLMRAGQALTCERVDIDGDGQRECWVHSASLSAVVAPHRGGAIEICTLLDTGVNLADTLTRRREAYHDEALARGAKSRITAVARTSAEGEVIVDTGSVSIHEIEHAISLDERPPADFDPRALFVERVIEGDVDDVSFARATYDPLASWARVSLDCEIIVGGEGVELLMECATLIKRVVFHASGDLLVHLTWHPDAFPREARFTTELSLARDVPIDPGHHATVWRYPIETVAKSERGLDRTVQGEAVVLSWPVTAGHATVRLGLAGK
jgi:hypothetical protein